MLEQLDIVALKFERYYKITIKEIIMNKMITQSQITLEINKQEPLISHIEIANQTNTDKDSTKKLIEKYLVQLEQLGKQVGFEIHSVKKGNNANQDKKIYMLDEKQSTLLVLMMRNTDIVLKFKVKLVTAFFEAKSWITGRSLSKLENKDMNLAIANAHEIPKSFHYSNESDMINRIVLSLPAKSYCESNGIDRDKLRDSLSLQQITAIQDLQKYNTYLIEDGMEYQERKEKLINRFNKKHQLLLGE
jgi:phage regulator Rha-like protein